MSRGRIIVGAIAVFLVAGPTWRMSRLVLGHWHFPAMLWVVHFGIPIVFAALLMLRQNWARLVVGWISVFAVAINVIDALLREHSIWPVLVRASVTILVGVLLLWTRSVRTYFAGSVTLDSRWSPLSSASTRTRTDRLEKVPVHDRLGKTGAQRPNDASNSSDLESLLVRRRDQPLARTPTYLTVTPLTLRTRTCGPPPGPAPVMISATPSPVTSPAATLTPPGNAGS
jgi:hypothetical protein